MVVLNLKQITYKPIHCPFKDEKSLCSFEQIAIPKRCMDEVFYLIAIIFSLGPIRVFFKIKEGKTSLEKIKDDYEDERGFLDDIIR